MLHGGADIPEGTAALGGPTPEQSRSEKEGAAERNWYVLTPNPTYCRLPP